MNSPLPRGEGGPQPAFSSAGAGRVRGLLLSFANQPLPQRLGRPSRCNAIGTEETPHPSSDGWRKRRRRTPSPRGRGLYFQLRFPPPMFIEQIGENRAFILYPLPFTPVSSVPRRTTLRPSPGKSASRKRWSWRARANTWFRSRLFGQPRIPPTRPGSSPRWSRRR